MRVFVFAATKGGVGKSTLAIQTGIRPARAAADCGDHKFSPCYVEIVGQPVLVVGR